MRFLLAVILIILFSALAEYFLPWWSLAAVAFFIAIALKMSPGKAFLGGLVAIISLWTAWALCWDIPNDHLLSGRMAKVFSLPNAALFIAVTAIIGGLVGGLSAWSGAHFRKLFSA